MFGLGGGELLLLGVIALVFIGPKKLPELARGLGKGIREFQKAKSEILDSTNEEEDKKLDSSSSSLSHSDSQQHVASTAEVIDGNEDPDSVDSEANKTKDSNSP